MLNLWIASLRLNWLWSEVGSSVRAIVLMSVHHFINVKHSTKPCSFYVILTTGNPSPWYLTPFILDIFEQHCNHVIWGQKNLSVFSHLVFCWTWGTDLMVCRPCVLDIIVQPLSLMNLCYLKGPFSKYKSGIKIQHALIARLFWQLPHFKINLVPEFAHLRKLQSLPVPTRSKKDQRTVTNKSIKIKQKHWTVHIMQIYVGLL